MKNKRVVALQITMGVFGTRERGEQFVLTPDLATELEKAHKIKIIGETDEKMRDEDRHLRKTKQL